MGQKSASLKPCGWTFRCDVRILKFCNKAFPASTDLNGRTPANRLKCRNCERPYFADCLEGGASAILVWDQSRNPSLMAFFFPPFRSFLNLGESPIAPMMTFRSFVARTFLGQRLWNRALFLGRRHFRLDRGRLNLPLCSHRSVCFARVSWRPLFVISSGGGAVR